ncbi:MAG: prepilin-type N-terminal cleavage/methylation domain-containing protein [Chloroflexi bacterium]|nr:prepilin-type N-terminal cleavage/methylation domain-containing protein [Chloroflexota bacterium]
MRNIVKNALEEQAGDQKGFTLIELLIVVGIIVSLVGVIIPLVIQFADKGEEGAYAAEAANVQLAIDEMMTVNLTTTIPVRGVVAVLASADEPIAGDPMANYLRDLPTDYQYTWIASGVITQEAVAPCN